MIPRRSGENARNAPFDYAHSFLSLFQRFLGETDRIQKFRLYEQLAERTVAPVGRLWQEGEVIMIPDVDVVTPDVETEALDFWESLVKMAPAE